MSPPSLISRESSRQAKKPPDFFQIFTQLWALQYGDIDDVEAYFGDGLRIGGSTNKAATILRLGLARFNGPLQETP
jgi:hypothetical protein